MTKTLKRNKLRSKLTSDELVLIRDSILLPMMLTIVQREYELLAIDRSVLRQLYQVAVQALMHRIQRELTAVKRELRANDIKVVDSDRPADLILYHKVIYRGYEDQFGMTRDVVKSEIGIRMGQYVAQQLRI